MKEGDSLSKQGGKKRKKSKKPSELHPNVAEGTSSKQEKSKIDKNKKLRKQHLKGNSSEVPHKKTRDQKASEHHNTSKPLVATLRKKVDPETAKYFSEIANLFESNGVDLEERSAICGNALEETRGKEVELAMDMIISRTLQCLLEGCDLEQLCGFLQNCVEGFSSIATDKFGSHVAETALKSLAIHLQDDGSYSIIEDTLTRICQVVVVDAVNVMCSRYGSHVIRSLLCLCKGVPLDSLEEFHVTKQSAILADRLTCKPAQSSGSNFKNFQHGFPAVYKFLTREMLTHAKDDIATLRINKYSSFVLQTVLNLLAGDDEELLHAILVLIGCHDKNVVEGKFIKASTKQDIMVLVEDTASSHLFEVIVKVAPEALYNEFLYEVFRGSLLEISSHQCGNFVVQALISSARSSNHMDLIWEELGTKIKELLEVGKPGVVASILATCQRLQTHVHECCQALAAAISSESESSSSIVPHLLFLDSYLRQKSRWKWPIGEKMHTLGCLMLQTIFRCSSQFIGPYVTSITSMEADHIFETAKDAGGSRVLEAFFCSDASAKQKLRVITKLHDHYGELSMHPASSFTVEKCFTASNVLLKEAIAVELLAVQTELSKTKHGPYLLKKLDIDGFARRPEQWKRSQVSREVTYTEFQAAFGTNSKLEEQTEASPMPSKRRRKNHEKMRGEIGHGFDASNATPSPALIFSDIEISGAKQGSHKCKRNPGLGSSADVSSANPENKSKKFVRNCTKSTTFVRKSGKRISSASELADLAGKQTLSSGEVRKLFKSTISNEKKQSGNERTPFIKKQK